MDFSVSRCGAQGRIRGKARGIFQMSGDPPLTFQRLEVYADGAIRHDFRLNAVDFGVFEKKLTRGEIDIVPGRVLFLSEYGPISVGLGSLERGEFQPIATKQDVIDWATKVIAELNPDREGLIDFEGQEVLDTAQPREGVTVRTLKAVGLSGDRYERMGQDETVIAGKPLRVAHRRDGEWFIDDMTIYADGQAQVGADGAVQDFGAVAEEFRREQISSIVPDGEWIGFPHLGRLRPSIAKWEIVPGDLLAEAEDVLAKLKGKPGCVAFCLAALRAYESTPDAENFDILKSAYEWTPTHMRFGSLEPETTSSAPISGCRVFSILVMLVPSQDPSCRNRAPTS